MSVEPPVLLRGCAWCATPFPPNDAIEAHPFGRRLAFDAARGRLWVVCARCERWNLAPIESRWEAIEECERTWRATPSRASTGEIGLAKLRDGTSLVRIGRPVPLEFAAWRYGDQFGRRKRHSLVVSVGAVAGVAALAAGAIASGAALVLALPAFQIATIVSAAAMQDSLRHDAPIVMPDGGKVTPLGAPKIVTAPEADGGWGLAVPYSERQDAAGRLVETSAANLQNNFAIGEVRLTGTMAQSLLARYSPKLNRAGASRDLVRDAVDVIAESGGPDRLARWIAANRARIAAQQTMGDSGDLQHLPIPIKLALEMSSHEETERALLAGELASLEAQWRAAEEEAAIADQLLLPKEVVAKLDALRAAVRRDA